MTAAADTREDTVTVELTIDEARTLAGVGYHAGHNRTAGIKLRSALAAAGKEQE